MNHAHLDFTKFSVAVLWLISQADEYFVWTSELFRRFPSRDDQCELARENRTYDHLFSMGRTLVWWFRFAEGTHSHGGYRSIADLRLEANGLMQNFPHTCPQYWSVACTRVVLALQWESETGLTLVLRLCSTLDALMVTAVRGLSLQYLSKAFHGFHDLNNNSLVFTELVPMLEDLLFGPKL